MLASLFTKKQSQNPFVSLLNELKVRHTASFSNAFFEQHPHKNNLYGLSKMLTDYSIENKGFRINDKISTIKELEVPFIAHTGSGFVVVSSIMPNEIEYLWKEKRIKVPTDKFLDIWSGVILLAEASADSLEPNFTENRKTQILTQTIKIIFWAIILLLFGTSLYITKTLTQLSLMSSLAINIAGVYICYLLLLKQMHIQSDYADKICSLLLHEGDCNDILESDAAKFLTLFSWSEIGFGYFLSNILIIVFLPSLYPYIALINICALPYTIWSVWYQKFIAKQWCPLCLVVQGLLWILFLCNLGFRLILWPDISLLSIILIGCIFGIPLLGINLLVPYLTKAAKVEKITREITSIKSDEKIFTSALKSKSAHPTDRNGMGLLWGNVNSKNMITVVTNPHCNPCSKMHDRLNVLLNACKNEYCIQYILTSFNEELEESAKLFIAIYQQKDLPFFLEFLNLWYSHGKNNREEFYKKYPFDKEDKKILKEMERNKEWVNKVNIHATPTVLFNGYELPENYKVEDLHYFTDLDIS